eukprot:gnl/MRDRNA2_/MRDRNA2_23730_c0_seq1.p1 gnl/MRDRNA2_/MRDRNA2_23730_c0~~gnl/MRDRNA2_/MRDRNA2_23730_c0_seq1.p1  ORF type:complete len:488 (+),score=89.51 gnl/MRDRNA2_/MRDRNA2_23730_c0_seq1:77-1465(+)
MTAAFMIHAGIHDTIGEAARVVIHTHQTAATALSCVEHERENGVIKLPLAERLAGLWGWDDQYEGIVNNREEGVRIARAMNNKAVLLMSNHGVTVAAQTVADAVRLVWDLETASTDAIIHMGQGTQSVRTAAEAKITLRDRVASANFIDGADDFFQQQSMLPENDPTGREGGRWAKGWNGRGPFQPVGYSLESSAVQKARIDLAAVHKAMCHSGLVDPRSAFLSMILPTCTEYLCTPSSGCWNSMSAEDLTLIQDAAQAETNSLVFELTQRIHEQHGSMARVVLLTETPPHAKRLVELQPLSQSETFAATLLPIVQDSMLFEGHTATLPESSAFEQLLLSMAPTASSKYDSEAAAAVVDEIIETLDRAHQAIGKHNAFRLGVSRTLTVVLGNSPAHALVLLERYEKSSAIQLMAVETGQPLRLISPEVVSDPRNGFLCKTTEEVPSAGQMHLEGFKRWAEAM